MFRALLIACCLTSFPALADGAAALGELVNQRLSLMKDVAGYKAQQHLPIEDPAQEAKVLASAQAEAGRLGLEPASVRPLSPRRWTPPRRFSIAIVPTGWRARKPVGSRAVGAGAPADCAVEQPDIATAGGAAACRPAWRSGSGGVYGVGGSGEPQRRRQTAAGGCAAGGQNRQRRLSVSRGRRCCGGRSASGCGWR